MARKTYIEPTPGAGFTQEVDPAQLTNKTASNVAYYRPVPFTLSLSPGRVNRTQGLSAAGGLTHEQYFYCQSDRCYKDLDNRSETLAQLAKKGHTVFRSGDGNEISEERSYVAGYAWLMYGNSGTNNSTANYDHNPGLTLRHSLEQICNNLNAIIVARGAELKYYIANFEFYEFIDGGGNGQHFWANVSGKSDPFYSPYDGQTHTLQELYNQGGVGLLNRHLHRKRAQLNTLFMQIMRRKNPSAKVTNGDFIPFHSPNINGELLSSQGNFAMTNYESVPYNVLLEIVAGNFGGMEPVVGGTVNLGGQSYDLSGREIDHYDFLSHYYYYNEIYIRQADWNEIQSTTDAAKLTVDYWQSKFWFDRFHVYKLPICHQLQSRFFQLHKDNGGKDLTALRKIEMHEHMYECNKTYITADNSSQTSPSGINYEANNPAPFMRWISGGGSQKLYIHRELIWIRLLQGAMVYSGTFVWWETVPGTDYTTEGNGKYTQFHQRSQEEHTRARDYIRQDEDIWGPGSTYTDHGIPMRCRKNGGDWSAWADSPSPVHARFGSVTNAPYILLREKPGKAYYAFFRGQEDSDITDIEYKRGGVIQPGIKLVGCMPATRTIRENLPTV